jgi:hypothetical protein
MSPLPCMRKIPAPLWTAVLAACRTSYYSFARRAERVSLSKRAPNSGTGRSAGAAPRAVPHHANNWLNRILTSCFTTSTVNASFGLVQPRLSYIVHLCECCWSPLLIFPTWMEGDEPSWSKSSTVTGGSKPKMPRSYHKKSRTGCQRCRARRVKASLFSCCLESFMSCLPSCDTKLLYFVLCEKDRRQ